MGWQDKACHYYAWGAPEYKQELWLSAQTIPEMQGNQPQQAGATPHHPDLRNIKPFLVKYVGVKRKPT